MEDFDRMLASLSRQEFTIGGQTFTVRKALSYKTMNMFISENTLNEFDTARAFFAKALIPADRDRFAVLLDYEGLDDEDDGNVISLGQMTGLIKWLMDYYTGRSEKKEESFSGGPPSTGQPSNPVFSTAGDPRV